jgi:hypothetical protein
LLPPFEGPHSLGGFEAGRRVELTLPIWAYHHAVEGGRDGYAFGELGATAATRRDVLASLLPRLKIAPRCTLKLPVEGDATLAVIVSKAILLAADDRISDEAIVRRIGAR